MKATKAYVIIDPDDNVYLNTIRIKRTDCVRDFEKTYNKKWWQYLNVGWKCIKIKITIDQNLKK
ncbi:hypothetical protein [Flavobacterium sp.]|uniref:hypothetical protein n=1 Tax=Flavobacterium sp. TaxID=239 RepID=UPI003D6B644D